MKAFSHDGLLTFKKGGIVFSTTEGCKKVMKTIVNYLAKNNLKIRPLVAKDLDVITEEFVLENLCQGGETVGDVLIMILDDYKDYVETNDLSSRYKIGEKLDMDNTGQDRYTYVVEHEGEIVSISSIYYTSEHNDIYIEIQCTNTGEKCGRGTNYFLNVYMFCLVVSSIHERMNAPVSWGVMENVERLAPYHLKRGCKAGRDILYRGNRGVFICNPVKYLNKFFELYQKFSWDGC